MVLLGSIVIILIVIWSLYVCNIKVCYCFYGEGSDDYLLFNVVVKEILKMMIMLFGLYDK